MQFSYCPDCGTQTVLRPVGDEGSIPFCTHCQRPLFEMFSTCVLSAVCDPAGNILLIRQSYGDTARYVGIAGYMRCGESAEEAAAREINEEIGVPPTHVQYVMSAWHAAKEQLMLCFRAEIPRDAAIRLSHEVAEARWFPSAEAARIVRQGSIIHRLVCAVEEDDTP